MVTVVLCIGCLNIGFLAGVAWVALGRANDQWNP